jgi:hypothetical protein
MTVEEARRLLSITSVPTPENIQKAYRRMAMNSHPDRYRTFPEKAWATRQFIKIKEARDVLVEGFASGEASTWESYQGQPQENSSGEAARPFAESNPFAIAEQSIASFSPFAWFSHLFEWVGGLPFPLNEVAYIPIMVIGILLVPLFVYFIIAIGVLVNICNECGIEAYPGSRNISGRLAYLLIITLVSSPFFVLPSFADSRVAFYVGIAFAGVMVLSVLIEWGGFFLVEVWGRSASAALQRFLAPQNSGERRRRT